MMACCTRMEVRSLPWHDVPSRAGITKQALLPLHLPHMPADGCHEWSERSWYLHLPIQIVVEYANGTCDDIPAMLSDTVDELKHRISEHKGVSIQDMRIYHHGEQLKESSLTLLACGLAEGSRVYLAVCARPSPPPRKARVFIKSPAGETLPFDVDLSATVEEAAEEAAVLCGSAESACTLSFRGKTLHGSRTLKDSAVEMGSVMHISF
eukprot:TRINITY_DN94928_c0_g1_i1.p2 TRINITY_DN94928_c0_g1~~TRINITY_DN94928_c0_g1_i1.p2  ORF type:complete len:209 (+),score=38.70 TRINITY_DN94928_c0_g1_i1:73-699(+)